MKSQGQKVQELSENSKKAGTPPETGKDKNLEKVEKDEGSQSDKAMVIVD